MGKITPVNKGIYKKRLCPYSTLLKLYWANFKEVAQIYLIVTPQTNTLI